MASEEDADFERTLCQIREVFVFKIPTRSSAAGHRAADWPKEPAMKAALKVSAKGRLAVVTMTNPQNGDIFATCPVTDDTAVERTLDSGRYFVFRIQNAQGRHAFIGVAFNERNDAFDFNVALSEHKRECDREDNAAKASEDATFIPFRDLSLKEGEKITVKIAGSSGTKKEKKIGTGGSFTLQPPPGSKGGLLAPPPADIRVASAQKTPSQTFPAAAAAAAVHGQGHGASVFGFVGTQQSGGGTPSTASHAFDDPFGFSSTNSATTTTTTTSTFRPTGSGEVNLLDL